MRQRAGDYAGQPETLQRLFRRISNRQASRRYGGAQAQVVINQEWAEGMGASIRCGLRALEAATLGRAAAVVLMLCDQPFVTSTIINRLLETYVTERPLLVASEYEVGGETARGVPALFSRALFSELMDLRGAGGAKRVIRRHSPEAAFIAAPEAAFDVDTPEDYRRLADAVNLCA